MMMPAAKIIDITDEGLINALQNNSETAFNELYGRYWDRLYLYTYSILRDKSISEDIIQDVFCDLWNRRNELDIERPSSYLYQAVKRQIFKRFRRKKLSSYFCDQFTEFISESKVEQIVEYKELNSRVEKLISELPEQRRIIFLMSRIEELSNKEIASQLNLSVRTVKNQISLALKFIRKSLKIVIFLFFR
jgi:RNA polymerase sigma-70 factor (family 1)